MKLGVVHDLRLAGRSLSRRWAFTVFATLTLTIGLGAFIAAVLIIDAVDVRALPYARHQQLVAIHTLGPRSSLCADCVQAPTIGLFRAWQTSLRSVSELTVHQSIVVSRITADERVRMRVGAVDANFAATLGVSPTIGRFFAREEQQAGNDHVIVLAHAFWQAEFGGANAILGNSISVTTGVPGAAPETYSVIGVMPKGFSLPPGVDGWVPLNTATASASRRISVLGRLHEGAQLDELNAELRTLNVGAFSSPDSAQIKALTLRQSLTQYHTQLGKGRFALAGIVGCVLVLTLANLVSLLAAQRLSRQRELAVRAALGATRQRLLVQPCLEIILVVALGASLGFASASYLAPAMAANLGIAATGLSIAFSPISVSVAVLVAAACAVVLAVVPLRHVLKLDIKSSLSRGTSDSRQMRAQAYVLVAEIALAFLVVGIADVFAREYRWARYSAPGYETDGLTYVEVGQRGVDALELLQRIEPHLPGVGMAVQGDDWTSEYRLEPQGRILEHADLPYRSIVSRDYFETLGIPILAGRPFNSADRRGTVPVVLVNQRAAERLWPGRSALGERLSAKGPTGIEQLVVVGVVEDARVFLNLKAPNTPIVYRPVEQFAAKARFLFVRPSGTGRSPIEAIRSATVGFFNEPLSRSEIRSTDDYLGREVVVDRFNASALATFSIVILVLAALGIYGLATYAVVHRWRELGIRVALGAGFREIATVVTGRILVITAGGLLTGLFLFLMVDKTLRTMFNLAAPANHLFLISGFLGVLVTTSAAVAVPLRRASSINPSMAIRSE